MWRWVEKKSHLFSLWYSGDALHLCSPSSSVFLHCRPEKCLVFYGLSALLPSPLFPVHPFLTSLSFCFVMDPLCSSPLHHTPALPASYSPSRAFHGCSSSPQFSGVVLVPGYGGWTVVHVINSQSDVMYVRGHHIESVDVVVVVGEQWVAA